MSAVRNAIRSQFPNLKAKTFKITSPQTADYNCIAWAAGDTRRYWWPIAISFNAYWPEGVSRLVAKESFIMAFETLGYEPCSDGKLEANYEKVVLYVDTDGKPSHMARQLPSGIWTSKLGQGNDIEHQTARGLEGSLYGKVSLYMKRRLPQNSQ